MKLTETLHGHAVVLALKGNVTGGPDVDAFRDKLQQLIAAGQKNVVIDLHDVQFMNSTGLGMMVGGLTTMRNAGGDLRLARTADRIESLLVITKLITIFQSFESTEKAVASFG